MWLGEEIFMDIKGLENHEHVKLMNVVIVGKD